MGPVVDFNTAIKHLQYFYEIPNKTTLNTLESDMSFFVKTASLSLVEYERRVGVNMTKVELLRDVCFLGGVISWRFNHKPWCYEALVSACADIVECATGKTFDDKYIKKLKKCRDYFIFSNGSSSSSVTFAFIPFYLLFKSNMRLNEPSLFGQSEDAED